MRGCPPCLAARPHACDRLNDGASREDEEAAPPARPVGSAADALQQAELVLGVQLDIQRSTSAHAAILQASALALQQPHVLDLPRWLLMPSRYKQHWIRYTLISVGAGYCGLFLIRHAVRAAGHRVLRLCEGADPLSMLKARCRHSRLSGSQDLERWMMRGVTAVRGAYQEHILKPLLTVRDELFQTFRQASQSPRPCEPLGLNP